MKNTKLYNVIFPIWFLMFFPPVILITLVGNFIIDSIVLISCFYFFKLKDLGIHLKPFYKKNILKVWVLGFIADIIGAVFLIVTTISGERVGLSNKTVGAISYDPFSSFAALLIIVFAMILSGFFIFVFNESIFKNQISDKNLKYKIALTIAIITIPWTFLLPTKWIH